MPNTCLFSVGVRSFKGAVRLSALHSILAPRMSTCDSAKTAWSPPSLGAACFMSIPAEDVPRAKSFYKKVFDWTFKPSPDPTSYPDASFAMFYTPSPILMGAIVKSSENSANTPGVGIDIYLLVDDIEGTFEKAKSAGGSVAMEMVADGNHTLRGKVADTEGNVIGILKWLAC